MCAPQGLHQSTTKHHPGPTSLATARQMLHKLQSLCGLAQHESCLPLLGVGIQNSAYDMSTCIAHIYIYLFDLFWMLFVYTIIILSHSAWFSIDVLPNFRQIESCRGHCSVSSSWAKPQKHFRPWCKKCCKPCREKFFNFWRICNYVYMYIHTCVVCVCVIDL